MTVLIQVRLREKLFIAAGSMLGVSTGGLDTMRCEFDEDATTYVSDACQRPTSADDAPVNASRSTTEMPPRVRRFVNLALPYTLTLFPCTTHGNVDVWKKCMHSPYPWI